MERRYQLAREDASTQSRSQTEQEKEALRRRFAAMGGLGSGASIKAEQTAEREGARRLATGMSAITQQELGDKQRLEEIDQGQKFQTSERLGSQDFTKGENQVNRDFSTSERIASQDFTSGENKLGREFITGERVAGQTFSTSERVAAQTFTREEQQRLEKLQERGIVLQEKELILNEKISNANLDLSKDTAGIQKKQAQGGILTSILGTGIVGNLTTKKARGNTSSSLFA
jgi:hypothetical protein